MYEQLIVDQTCVLGLDGIESVELGPGELCEFGPVVFGTGPDDPGEHCTEASGGDGIDETSEGDGADETTGEMFSPFGNSNP